MLVRIFLFAYQIYFKFAKRRYLKKRNFTYIQSLFDETPIVKQEIYDLLLKFSNNDFDGFEADYDAMRQNDEYLSGGQLKSSLVLDALVTIINDYDMKAAQERLAALNDWWQKDKTAFSCGLYAYYLYQRGWSKRGGGYISDVSEGGMQGYSDYLVKASDVLNDCHETTDNCLIWNLANYCLHSDGGVTRDELHQYFEKCVALEPYNLAHYANHAFRLMPRWFGDSMQDVEDFARIAVERTKDKFGAGAYAAIYYLQSTIAENPFDESFCDLDLLDQGFEDLYARFGGQTCVNYHLMVLNWAMAHKRALPLVENRLTTIVTNAWCDEDMGDNTEYANLSVTMIGLKLFTIFEDDEDEKAKEG
ncbi:hypothetical protein N5853_14460 (plasmid) [Bartonella sp. HY329]|uniref:hypothetical protein n=1 Tax=unclassified Bartonella TaxID=2645622 RepID=UPI0021C79C4B|nr:MULTISPECIES: hypothetical protein [unclassified Bartonella]UXM96519.1 hypothetical protein N5853_14460 [Bartonella sp. HY329]UXN10842.1 hypothetical protein N5852_14465 [Bartonella sp. HY328]